MKFQVGAARYDEEWGVDVSGCDFSFRHYKECIELAKSKGYKFLRFSDREKVTKGDKAVFMRHDVDITLDNAMKMAEIEKACGVNATYFIRLDANYNVFNIVSLGKVKRLVEMGHEIGLHYSPDLSRLSGGDLLDDLRFWKGVLERVIGSKVSSIAPHEPTRCNHWAFDGDDLKKLESMGVKSQAYGKEFFKDMKYISDSSCNWREGCMHEFFEKGAQCLCILTHPFWWYENSPIETY